MARILDGDPLETWLRAHGCEAFPCFQCVNCGSITQTERGWCAVCATAEGFHLITEGDKATELAEEAALQREAAHGDSIDRLLDEREER